MCEEQGACRAGCPKSCLRCAAAISTSSSARLRLRPLLVPRTSFPVKAVRRLPPTVEFVICVLLSGGLRDIFRSPFFFVLRRTPGTRVKMWGRMVSCARPRGYPGNRRLPAHLQRVPAGYQPVAGCQPAPQPRQDSPSETRRRGSNPPSSPAQNASHFPFADPTLATGPLRCEAERA